MSEFLEEVKSVFSYLGDDYDINITPSQLESVYIHIDHIFTIGNHANYSKNDINELLDSSQRITILFESIMDCLLKLSITGDLYHNTVLGTYNKSTIYISLSRNYFTGSELMQKMV